MNPNACWFSLRRYSYDMDELWMRRSRLHHDMGPQVEVRGCFFHLCQSTWRKIQDLGLAQSYRGSEDVKHFCCMIDALAFLPVDQVSDGMQYLFSDTPEGNHDTLIELLTYFDATYVTGTARQIHRQRDASNTISVRRIPPLYSNHGNGTFTKQH